MNSSKLVRVSNSRRPLKLISSNGSLEEFELSGKKAILLSIVFCVLLLYF